LAKRRSKPKYSLVSLLILLAFFFYYTQCTPDKEPRETKAATEKPATKAKKRKPEKELRYLTVFEGKVTGIKDGDTFEVLYDGQPERVRLAEIDCPEKSQAFGKNARQYASGLCFGKMVTVTSNGKRDRYNRVVGTIVTVDGVNVNAELVKAGLAWHYKQYSKSEALAALEEQARQVRIGLWADKDPVAPWEWRKSRRR
jgi:micrococcal nuclease